MAGLDGYLEGLNEQEVQKEKELVVVKSSILESLGKKFEKFKYNTKNNPSEYVFYMTCLDLIKELNYTAKEIKDFSMVLKKYEKHKFFSIKAGLFLSALINTSKESGFEIITAHLLKIDYVGYFNQKKLTVFGNLGDYAGMYGKKGGNLIVQGDVGYCTGQWMHDGKIIVKGKAGEGTGNAMYGGKIIVKGSAGTITRYASEGGEIYVEGELETSVKERGKAKLYHKGELIWLK